MSISLHNVLTSFVNKPVNARHKALIMLTGIYSLGYWKYSLKVEFNIYLFFLRINNY